MAKDKRKSKLNTTAIFNRVYSRYNVEEVLKGQLTEEEYLRLIELRVKKDGLD